MRQRITYRVLLPLLYAACAIWPTVQYHYFQIEAAKWAGWILCFVTYPFAQQLYVSLNFPALSTLGMLFQWLNSKWNVGLPPQPSLGSMGLSDLQLAAISATMCVFWYGLGWMADMQRLTASLPKWARWIRMAILVVTGFFAILLMFAVVAILWQTVRTHRPPSGTVFALTFLTWNAGIYFLLRHRKVSGWDAKEVQQPKSSGLVSF